MATVDNVSAVEWTASWGSTALTHLQAYSALSGGTFYGEVALGTSLSPASGATVRIPAGDLDVTLTAGSGVEDALAAELLDVINATNGKNVFFGWATASGPSNEVNPTSYARQQPSFS